MECGADADRRPQVFWPKIVLKKWLNLKSKDLDFGADDDEDEDDDEGSDVDGQGMVDDAFLLLLWGSDCYGVYHRFGAQR